MDDYKIIRTRWEQGIIRSRFMNTGQHSVFISVRDVETAMKNKTRNDIEFSIELRICNNKMIHDAAIM